MKKGLVGLLFISLLVITPTKAALLLTLKENGTPTRAKTGISAREIVEGLLTDLKFERGIVEDDVLRSKLNTADTIPMPEDSIVTDITRFINDGGGISKDDLRAYYYADKGDYATTDSIIDYYNGFYKQQNLAKMIDVYKTLKQNNQTVYDIVSDTLLQQEILEVLSDSTREGYASALAFLQEIFGNRHLEMIQDIPEDEEKSMMTTTHIAFGEKNDNMLQCYPNPAKDNIVFKYKLAENNYQGTINIYNSIGQKVKTISIAKPEGLEYVNLKGESSGLYFYTLIVNSTSIANGKFIINK